MDYQQQQHRYMRPLPPPPPPPAMADPHHQQPPRQPAPPPAPWFSGQFQYHHPPQQHSPSPPPYNQWPPPPPHPDHLPPPPYHHHPPPPPPPHQIHNQYPLPPRPPSHPPPPHPHSQIPQPYHQGNHDWGNTNWSHHQGWEYPVHSNEEDWAARAREWAAAKSATDSQHPPSQFAPVGRQEEQSHYHEHYPQSGDPYYADVPQPPHSASSYQQFPAPGPPTHRPPMGHLQEPESVRAGHSSYILDGRQPYSSGNGTLAGDTNPTFPHQESSHTSPSVHQQEVPSSYSSVAGKEETGYQNKFYPSYALPMASTQGHFGVHPPHSAVGTSVSVGNSHYTFGNPSAEPMSDLSNQPLNFAPRFNREHDVHVQPNYSHTDSGVSVRGGEPVAPMASIHTWTPSVAPGGVYPPIPPAFPSGLHDPSAAMPSQVSGHSGPIYGRMPAPGFQPTVPSVGAPFGIGTGTSLHPASAFPGDVYVASSVSERPKKASVPNWLREEIIKKNAIIATSASEHLKKESQSIEDEAVDRSIGKGDLGDSKSVDSDEEDDDEDYVEATRTAAINQEIKRVLTEVLLKVTDELFDEIATKVVSETDLTVEDVAVDHSNVAVVHTVTPSIPATPTPKASAKVLIPAQLKNANSENIGGKSTSSAPGDVLGLGSYASDDDEDDGTQSSSMTNSKEDTIRLHPSSRNFSEDIEGVKKGTSQSESKEHIKGRVESEPNSRSPNGVAMHDGPSISDISDRTGRETVDDNSQAVQSSKIFGVGRDGNNFDSEKEIDGSDVSKSRDSVNVVNVEQPLKNGPARNSVMDVSLGRENRNKPDNNNRLDTKRSASVKEFSKEAESSKIKTDEKGDEIRRRQDDRYVRKEKADDWNVSKERIKEQGVKSGERAREHDSRKKSSHPDYKDDRKETERDRRTHTEEDSDRKMRVKDEKGERSKRKHTSESSRHKRRRSSSDASKGRNSKDNSVVSDAGISSDEASDDAKRKLQSKRRNLSPSPVRSRKRQVSSPPPHGKHTQRRHSPYPPHSLDTRRGRRSRSRSPVRRHR